MLPKIYDKALADPQRVAFPEAENERILQAAYESGQAGYIHPLLVGDPTAIKAKLAELNYDPAAFELVDIHDEAQRDRFIAQYVALPQTLLKEKALKRRMKDPLYYAMVMQVAGAADVTFAGIEYTTEDVLLAGQMVVGMQDGINTISSIGICEIPGFQGSEGEFLVVGDSAVCTNPTSEQLADIAISACESVQALLDWTPRCALLSYSTLGSGQGELVDKVSRAVKLANQKRPDLAIDGEFQFDAAISPAVAAKKVQQESQVAGKANIVIWPDLNVGNVGVKILQQVGHADAYGPILQGFNTVICDCLRSAPVSELKGNIVLSAVRASRFGKEAKQ